MDWTRVKPQHILYTSYTPEQRGNLLTLLCLTAHLERLPIEAEMRQHVHYKGLTSLQEALNDHSTTLQEVLNKVVEDAQCVQHQRRLNAKHQKTYKNKQNGGKPLPKAVEKIREDNIRDIGEKPRTYKPFLKPSLQELKEYITSKGGGVEAQQFLDFYDSKGWMIGKNHMKDWRAAVRNWIAKRKADEPHQPKRKYLN